MRKVLAILAVTLVMISFNASSTHAASKSTAKGSHYKLIWGFSPSHTPHASSAFLLKQSMSPQANPDSCLPALENNGGWSRGGPRLYLNGLSAYTYNYCKADVLSGTYSIHAIVTCTLDSETPQPPNDISGQLGYIHSNTMLPFFQGTLWVTCLDIDNGAFYQPVSAFFSINVRGRTAANQIENDTNRIYS